MKLPCSHLSRCAKMEGGKPVDSRRLYQSGDTPRRHASHRGAQDMFGDMATAREEVPSPEMQQGQVRPMAIGDSVSLRDGGNQTNGTSFLYATQKLRSRAFVQSPDSVVETDDFHKSVFEVGLRAQSLFKRNPHRIV